MKRKAQKGHEQNVKNLRCNQGDVIWGQWRSVQQQRVCELQVPGI